ncbi:Uncharacterised protein [Mycolicibacterium aurum]|uniref:Uncharacterized protein n=1 Tax=Mycolicibacterium aurum TaxID=1791 RepID=A0A448IJF4_MYCAU|nr:Uncharacterised protein [Mycolicibacterium aurum]
MNSNSTVFGVSAVGMSRALHAPIGAHPAIAAATAVAAAPRKRRAAAATAVASVRGFTFNT